MSAFWSRITFAGVALLLLYGAHRYAWARFARDVRISRAWKIGATIGIALLGVSIPAAFFLGRRSMNEGQFSLTLTAYLWLGFLFYCVLCLAALDLARLVYTVWLRFSARKGPDDVSTEALKKSDELEPSRAPMLDSCMGVREDSSTDRDAPMLPERRVFLARAVAGTAALGAGGIAIGGYRSAMGDITTPEIAVHLARLPRELSGYRIVQMSDLHLGPTLGERFLEAVVEKANAQRPDLVVITGDMVDGQVETLGRALAPLAKLSARHGIVFVTGNHEYYSGADEWIAFLREQGVRVLMNERLEIGDAITPVATTGGDDIWRAASAIGSRRARKLSFDLVGIPDLHAGSYSDEHAPDLARALTGRDPAREVVLLAHQPSQIAMAENKGVGLQLSGHTHGGQMWPFGALVSLAQPYIAGLHRHPDGTQIYVSRGTGFWGPPLRVASPAEVATIVLVSG